MQQVQPVAPQDLAVGIDLHRLEKRVDGGTKGGHRGHCGGEILLHHGGRDGCLGLCDCREQRALLVGLGELRVAAVGVFDAVALLGLRQDVVGPLEPLKQVLAVVGLEERGKRLGTLDEQGEVIVAGHGEAGVDDVVGDAAVAEMVDPPTDFMGMLWPIGTARDDEPDPSTFDGDPFREHTAVLSPDEIEEAAAYFADWQSGLAGCDEQEMREFDNGAQRVERWIRGGADVATAPDPCLKSRSAVMAWNAGQDVETARHIFFHEAYHGLSNYLLRQCAPILNRDEDSMNDLRWFAEGTADYFSMYMQAQEDERDDLEQRILQRATLDLQGDPGLTLGSNTYVQTAAMVLMIKRGIVSEEKIIDGSYFNNCDWIDTFDPSEPQIAYIFENFRNIEASNGTFAYSNETIAG